MKLTFLKYNVFACVLCLGMVVSTFSLSAQDTPEDDPLFSMSLNSAILFALSNNPDIEIFWARYNQAKNFSKEGQAGFYPQIDMAVYGARQFKDPSAGRELGGSDIVYGTGASITLNQMIFDGFETLEEVRRRENLEEASFWRIQSTIQEVMTNTVDAYLNITRYQTEININSALIVDIKKTLKNIQERYDAGAAEKVVLDYANSRLAAAKTQMRRSVSSLNDAVSRLEYLTGKLPTKFTTYYPEELYPDKLDLQYYLDYVRDNNSTLVAQNYEIDAMHNQLESEKGAFLPSVDFQIKGSQDHNNGGAIGRERDLTSRLSVRYTIFDGFQRDYTLKRAHDQVAELQTIRERLVKELRRDVKQSYNQVTANVGSIETTDDEIQSSKDLKFLNEENFRLGNINIIELIESSERLTQAQLRRVELRSNLYFHTYKLLLLSNMIDQEFFCTTC